MSNTNNAVRIKTCTDKAAAHRALAETYDRVGDRDNARTQRWAAAQEEDAAKKLAWFDKTGSWPRPDDLRQRMTAVAFASGSFHARGAK